MDTAPIVLAHEKSFRIGEATIWPASREVQLNGTRAVIEPKVMQLLVALHRGFGGVVTKDELLQQCWDGRIIGEDAINRVVSRLRSVADKQAGKQFRVETITKVGYRLVAGNGDGQPLAPANDVPASHAVRRREVMIGGTVLGAAAIGVGWNFITRNGMPHEARVLLDDSRNSLYQFTPDQIDNAVGKLRRATQLAPDSAEAWGLLSLAYANSTLTAPANQRANRLARSEEARQRAYALQAYQPDALAAELGTSRVFRNWLSQEQACRTALHRHPGHPVLHVALGHLLLEVGRLEEALPLFQASLQQTPLCVTSLLCRILTLSGLGRFEEADLAMGEAFNLMPRQPAIWFTRLHYLAYTGRTGEAAAMVLDESSRPIGISDPSFELVALQVNALESGDRTTIRQTIEAYDKAARRGTVLAENAAVFAAYVGRSDEAFRILYALYFDRGFRLPATYLANEQGMYSSRERRTNTLFRHSVAAIRRDPRFDTLTDELGLNAYWERTGSRSKVVA